MRCIPRCSIVILCLLSFDSVSATGQHWEGESLNDYLQFLIQQGLALIYSNDLVTDDYTVQAEPTSVDPEKALRRALRPFGLILEDGPNGSLLVVRDINWKHSPPASVSANPDERQFVQLPELSEIVVISSVYNIRHHPAGSYTFLDRTLTTKLPNIADEIVRSLDRLPGVAGNGVSTRSHIRGGAKNEQLYLFDGVRLYEPFHLKDFHAVSTIVNQNSVDGIDFYSAGYQARYGDRMSGVIDIGLRQPSSTTETEIELSLFNTSFMSLGRFARNDRGDWLVSVRRGNLDIISDLLESNYGSPEFEDALMHVGWELSDRTDISMNALYSNDEILLQQPDESENARARYRNLVLWMKARTDWTPAASSLTIISINEVSNSRNGHTNNPGVVEGQVTERRNFHSMDLKQDWQFHASNSLLITTGFNIKHVLAKYDYTSSLTISEPFDQILDNVPLLEHNFHGKPRGNQYDVYLESRWKIADKLIVDLGLRWDRQDYTMPDKDIQFSPRANILYEIGNKTELRLGFGRFYQAQEINELQISDGQSAFFPAQRARHMVASLSHQFPNGADLLIEIYKKKYRSLMPRYENVLDPFVLIPELQIDRVRIDADSAVATGAEIMFTAGDEDNDLLWWASYAWSASTDRVGDEDVHRGWDQTHAVKAGINWDWKRWSFSATGIVRTGWPRTDLTVASGINADGNIRVQATTTALNSQRHAGFQSLDVRASRRFKLPRGELTTFVEVTNILNRKNPCCSRFTSSLDENGEIVVHQKKGAWLPAIPSLGVTWRF